MPSRAARMKRPNHSPSAKATTRKPRPSRARGLRVNTGCVICRQRRVKCDEVRPLCGPCGKSQRDCHYVEPKPPRRRGATALASTSQVARSEDPEQDDPNLDVGQSMDQDQDRLARKSSLHLDGDDNVNAPISQNREELVPNIPFDSLAPDSPATINGSTAAAYPTHSSELHVLDSLVDPSLGLGPGDAANLPLTSELGLSPSSQYPSPYFNVSATDWYDLVAQDAISSLENNSFTFAGQLWNFDANTLSRRQSPEPGVGAGSVEPAVNAVTRHGVDPNYETIGVSPGATELLQSSSYPWNSQERILLSAEEQTYLHYYVTTVGPILDLVDPTRQFSNTVPHLAMYNVGLLKSVIAIASRHMALHDVAGPLPAHDASHGGGTDHQGPRTLFVATQYYYETLQYLSQNLLHSSYARSFEIVATALLISMYEMFDAARTDGNGNWERHLRGSFWIHRSQDTNGEKGDQLRRACWWLWVRQDIWAAFREGRRSLTIFRPIKALNSLNDDQLATRIIFLAARCVDYSAESAAECRANVNKCISHGDRLLQELDRWHCRLSPCFRPIRTAVSLRERLDGRSPQNTSYGTETQQTQETAPIFMPLWIHPPAYAAAIQMYHFSRIIVLLNQPTTGGRNVYLKRQKLLDESADTICGIACAKQGEELPSALVNSQALFVAGLCVQSSERKEALLKILEKSLAISKVPHRSLVDDLKRIWDGDD